MTIYDYMPDLAQRDNEPVAVKMVQAPVTVLGEHLFIDADVRIYDEQEATVSVHIIKAMDGTEDVTKAIKLLDLASKVKTQLALVWEDYVVDEKLSEGGR